MTPGLIAKSDELHFSAVADPVGLGGLTPQGVLFVSMTITTDPELPSPGCFSSTVTDFSPILCAFLSYAGGFLSYDSQISLLPYRYLAEEQNS